MKTRVAIIAVGALLLLGVGGFFLFFNKPKNNEVQTPDATQKEVVEEKTYTNKVTLECPDEVTAGAEIECSIKMEYSQGYKILSINANYVLPDGIRYVSFTSNCSGCEIDEHTVNGFAIGKLAGLGNDIEIGKVKLSISSNFQKGSEYSISLKNVEYSTSDYKMITLPSTSKKVTVK